MQELRNVLLTSPDERLKSLLGLCEEMQTLRDELLPKEYDYDLIEDQLITEEFELQETGEKMLSILDGVPHSLVGDSELGSPLEEEISQIERTASRGSAIQRPEVVEYLSRLGDRDIVLERLSELRHERATLVEEEKSRARFGMALHEEAQTFLDTFDVRHDSLKKELAAVDADLARLSQTLEHYHVRGLGAYSSIAC
jgi:NAD-specific glutamate dehydrogenase